MSLARTLMGGNTAVTESVDVTGYDFSNAAALETTWVDTACESLFTDIYNVDKAFAVADVIGEVKVLTEGADPEVILESIVKDGVEKLKDAFKKFWAKLKAWFQKVKDFFKKLFLSGKKFITEFEKQIKQKASAANGIKGFKYRAFKYDFGKGDSAADKLFKDVEVDINYLLGMVKINEETGARNTNANYRNFTDELIVDALKRQGKDVKDGDKPMSASDYQDDFCKKCDLKGSDVSEITDSLAEIYRSGETEMEEFEEFETASVDDMIEFIKTFDKKVSSIEKDERAFEKTINAIIKTLDGVKKDDEKSGGEAGYKVAQKLSGYMSAMLTVGKVPSTVKAAAYKEAAGVYERVLKSFLSFRPAKEGYEEDDDDFGVEEGCGKGKKAATESSLFESAYNFI